MNESDEKLDVTEDNEPTFSSSFFMKDVQLMWKLLKTGKIYELAWDTKKGENCHLKNMTKMEQFNTKKRKRTLPKIESPDMMDTSEEDNN